jgi:hypothetical protein
LSGLTFLGRWGLSRKVAGVSLAHEIVAMELG